MRILITGARGMLGTAVVKILEKEHDLITPVKHQLNIGNLNQVMKFNDIDFIVHLASETDHEYCDENPSQCYFINTIGVANMMRLARSLNIPIFYMSTASIFDGNSPSAYKSDSPPNPINHYNSSKWYGELLASSYHKHYILRTGWLFGGGPDLDKKFVNKIMTKVFNGETHIKVASDCIGSPTYTNDLALKIKDCIDGKAPFGTHHCVNSSEGVSRYQVACEMKRILGLNVKIEAVSIDDLKAEFPCKRTNYEVLKSDFPLRPWQESLAEYLNDYYRY